MIWDCPTIVRLKDVSTTKGAHCVDGSIARGNVEDDCVSGGSAADYCAENGNVADQICFNIGDSVG